MSKLRLSMPSTCPTALSTTKEIHLCPLCRVIGSCRLDLLLLSVGHPERLQLLDRLLHAQQLVALGHQLRQQLRLVGLESDDQQLLSAVLLEQRRRAVWRLVLRRVGASRGAARVGARAAADALPPNPLAPRAVRRDGAPRQADAAAAVRARPPHRRDRHGQGTRGARPARGQPTGRCAVRRDRLRGPARDDGGGRVRRLAEKCGNFPSDQGLIPAPIMHKSMDKFGAREQNRDICNLYRSNSTRKSFYGNGQKTCFLGAHWHCWHGRPVRAIYFDFFVTSDDSEWFFRVL